MFNDYKANSHDEIENFQSTNMFEKYLESIPDEQDDINKIQEIFSQIDNFFGCEHSSAIESIKYLLNEIPNAPDNFQLFLSNNFLFTEKLFELFIPVNEIDEVILILNMFHFLTTSDNFRDREMTSEHVTNNNCLRFCFSIIHKMFEESEKKIEIEFFELALNCLTNFITKFNYDELDKSLFDDLRMIFLERLETALECSRLVEKMSQFVPFSMDYKYFFDFVHFACVQPNPFYAYFLYSTIRNIVKKDNNLLRVPENTATFNTDIYWTYNFILNSYKYDDSCQDVVFDLCSYLSYQSISAVLSNDTIRQNVFNALLNPEGDIRVKSIFRALRQFMNVDPNNFEKYYFSLEISEQLTPILIQHVIESTYNVKYDAGYLLSFAIKQKPSYFIRGIINHELIEPFHLLNLKAAIQAILDIDQPSLILYLLHSIQTLCEECSLMEILDDLYIAFHDETEIYEQISRLNSTESNPQLTGDSDELITQMAKDILKYFEVFQSSE